MQIIKPVHQMPNSQKKMVMQWLPKSSLKNLQIYRKQYQKHLTDIEKEIANIELGFWKKKIQKYIGKYFKKFDSYGTAVGQWYIYRQCVGVKEESLLLCNSFQTDANGKLVVELEKGIFEIQLGEEISKEEYEQALVDIYENTLRKL